MKKELTVEEILEMMDYDFEHFHHNESSVLAYDKLRQQADEIEALKAKTLTDEEFISVYTTWALTSNDPLVLKQAILRKAQEK